MKTYHKNGKELPYIIKVKNNKHTYFRIKEDHLEVSKSRYLSNDQILKLIDQKFDYFINKLKKIKDRSLSDNQIMIEDKVYNLEIINSKDIKYNIVDNTVVVNHPSKNIEEIKKWIYTNHLIKMINSIQIDVNNVLFNNNIKPIKIKLKYFKSKYGSYHRKNDEISLNIILSKIDIMYLYYVLMHEYAHTLVFNHSKAFYALLEKLMPNYKLYHKKLKAMAIYI